MRFGLQPESGSEPEQEVKLVAPILPLQSSSRYGMFAVDDDDDDYASEPFEEDSDSDLELQPSPLQHRRAHFRIAPVSRTQSAPVASTSKAVLATPTKAVGARRSPGKENGPSPIARLKSTPTGSRARPPATPLPRTSLSSRYDILQRSLKKASPIHPISAKPQLVVYDSDDSEHEETSVMPIRDYSTIPNYQPTEPQAFREAKWTAYRDPLEEWERQAKEASLRRAHSSFRLHTSRIDQQRRAKEKEMLQTIEETQSREVEEVERLLATMRVQQEEEERELRVAHEQRKRDLWERVDQALALESAAQAEAERKRQEEARKQKEEQERRETERQEQEKRRKAEQERFAEEARKKDEEEKAKAVHAKAEQEAAAKRRSEAEAAAARRAAAAAKDAEEAKKNARWNHWTSELQTESDIMQAKTEAFRKAVEAIDEGGKPREIKKACADARRSMRKALATITRELSVISRVAKQCQQFFVQAVQGDQDAFGYLLHHYALTVLERAEEAMDFKDIYPLAHCTKLLLTEGGLGESLADAMYCTLAKETWTIEAVKPASPEGMSEDQWEAKFGKQREDEAALAYAARISNYIALYAAICQSDTADDDGRVPPQFTMDALWKRMTNMLKPPQDSDWMAPHVVAAIFQVAGKRMEEVYGEAQFAKLRNHLLSVCTPEDDNNPHWLGRDDAMDTATAGREKLTAILRGWEKGLKLSEGREWEDDVPGGVYIPVEGGADEDGSNMME